MTQESELWFVVGILIGAVGVIVVKAIWELTVLLFALYMATRREKQDFAQGIQELEEFVNKEEKQ
jgi:hypothetical protein